MNMRLLPMIALAVLSSACEKQPANLQEAAEQITAPVINAPLLFESEPKVRVLILEGADNFKAEPFMQYIVKVGEAESMLIPGMELKIEPTQTGVQLLVSSGETVTGEALQISPYEPGGYLKIRDVAFGQGWWWENAEDRTYNGIVDVQRDANGKLNVIVELPVEEYLRGVVPSEIGPTAPLEALKAQAVAARSETITALRKGLYSGPGYDICSTVQCQVYGGTSKGNPQTDQAILETRGLVLAYNGETIPAYYASNCGGHSEDIANVWSNRASKIPVWKGVPEGPEPLNLDLQNEKEITTWINSRPAVYCNRDAFPELPEWAGKNFRWTKEMTVEEMTAQVAKTKDIGTVKKIVPISRGISGRLNTVKFIGEKGDLEVGPELNIRKIWEPPLKSSAFIVEKKRKGDTDVFLITGAGYGHGVGMCQTGAMGRAMAGQTATEILTHYYSGAEILSVYK